MFFFFWQQTGRKDSGAFPEHPKKASAEGNSDTGHRWSKGSVTLSVAAFGLSAINVRHAMLPT